MLERHEERLLLLLLATCRSRSCRSCATSSTTLHAIAIVKLDVLPLILCGDRVGHRMGTLPIALIIQHKPSAAATACPGIAALGGRPTALRLAGVAAQRGLAQDSRGCGRNRLDVLDTDRRDRRGGWDRRRGFCCRRRSSALFLLRGGLGRVEGVQRQLRRAQSLPVAKMRGWARARGRRLGGDGHGGARRRRLLLLQAVARELLRLLLVAWRCRRRGGWHR